MHFRHFLWWSVQLRNLYSFEVPIGHLGTLCSLIDGPSATLFDLYQLGVEQLPRRTVHPVYNVPGAWRFARTSRPICISSRLYIGLQYRYISINIARPFWRQYRPVRAQLRIWAGTGVWQNRTNQFYIVWQFVMRWELLFSMTDKL